MPPPPPPHHHHSASRPGNLLTSASLLQYAPARHKSPTELRRLVIDYLCHSCYLTTALSVARSAAAESDAYPSTSFNGASSSHDAAQPARNGQSAASKAAVKREVVERTVRFDEHNNDESMEVEDDDEESDEYKDASADGQIEAPDKSASKSSALHTSDHSASIGSTATHGQTTHSEDEADELKGFPDLSSEDIRTTRMRLRVRDFILHGKIREAINLIEAQVPAVIGPSRNSLPPQSSATPGTGPSYSKPLHRSPSRVSFTTRPVNTTSLASSTHSLVYHPTHNSMAKTPATSHVSRPSFGAGPDSTYFVHPMFASLEPPHIALSLQIQVFIEFVRDASLASSTSSTTHQSESGASPTSRSMPPSSPKDLSSSIGNLSDNASVTSSTSAASARTAALSTSLSHCQALWKYATMLPQPAERAVWMKELEGVSALLGYPDPNESPLRGYLGFERRQKLAERVNAAILVHLGKSPTPIMEMVAQQTTWAWATLRHIEYRLPTDDKNQVKTCPNFDLTEFLQSGDSMTVDS